jgi:hypothetical protein
MARVSVKATLGQSLGNGQFNSVASLGGDPTGTVDTTELDAAIAAAQLIGTGDASAEIDAIDAVVLAATGAVAGDLVLSWDGAVITTMNELKAALEAALQSVRGSGTLTG